MLDYYILWIVAASPIGSAVTYIRQLPVRSWIFAVGLILVGFAIKVASSLIDSHKQRKLMPPSPSGLPLVGHIFQLSHFQWLRFTEWKSQLGPIFSLNLAGQPVIVLNSFNVAADLLDRRSNIYSDRPRFIMAREILTGNLFLAIATYGDFWLKLRRAAHEGLNSRVSQSYQPLQEKESIRLVSYMLQNPDAWDEHIRRSAASTVLRAVYGWPPLDSSDDPLVERINQFVARIVRACLPGEFLVELFPMMKFLPCWMAKWKREGFEWHRKDTLMFEGFMGDVRKSIHTGTSEPSFAASLIEDKKHDLSSKEAAWLAGNVFAAGAETTGATMAVFMLAMTLYPDVMHRAQAEIDAIVGRDRMPTFADRDKLPYIRAMVKEVLRWRPVTPLGGPRRVMRDDWYNGYFIPKGTIVLPNVWAMNQDPVLFPDFDEFRPERFLDASGMVDDTIPDTHSQGHATYGFGKRICVGMHFANQSLFMTIASLLWAVTVEKAVDADGNHIIPSRTDFIDEGMVVRPAPFKCIIEARSSDVRQLVEMAMDN